MASALIFRLLGAAALVGLVAAEGDVDACLTLFLHLANTCGEDLTADLTAFCAEGSECSQGIKEVPGKCGGEDWYELPDGDLVNPFEQAMEVEHLCNSPCLLKFASVKEACTGCDSDYQTMVCESFLNDAANVCSDSAEEWPVGDSSLPVLGLIATLKESVTAMCSPCTTAAMNLISVVEGECMMNTGLICQEGNKCNEVFVSFNATCGTSSFYDFESFEERPGRYAMHQLSMACDPCMLALTNVSESVDICFSEEEPEHDELCGFCYESIQSVMDECTNDEMGEMFENINDMQAYMEFACSSSDSGSCQNPVFIPHEMAQRFQARLCI